jgi:uncharacterized protein (DUF433 family)
MTDDDLIQKHINPSSTEFGYDRARLCEMGVPVWVVIAYDQSVDHNTADVARTYSVSEEAVEAARAYYRQHRCVFDAKIKLEAAAFH